MQQTETRALVALAFTTLIWGITPVFVRSVSLFLGPTQALIIRLLLTGLVFILVLALTSGFRMERRDLMKLAPLSLLGMLGYYVGTIFGFLYVPAGVGTLILSTAPLMIAILASLIGTERLGVATILGLIVSFAGSVLLVWGESNSDMTVTSNNVVIGSFMILFASVTWSAFVVLSKPLIQKYGALKITGVSNLIIMVPALPFISGETISAFTGMNQNEALSLAFLILVGATLAVFTWNYAAGHLRPSLLSSSLYVMPVLALVAGWAILNETITQNTLFAAALIVAGVAISQYRSSLRKTT